MIKVIAYKKDRKRAHWITLVIGNRRFHLSKEEAVKLSSDLKLVVVFDNPELERKMLKEGEI